MDKLSALIRRSKSSVSIHVNDHKHIYMSVVGHLLGEASLPNDDQYIPVLIKCLEISEDTLRLIISNNTIINVQFYPRTSISSYGVYHYDLDKCLDACLDIINNLEDKS